MKPLGVVNYGDMYFCGICNHKHHLNSKIGKKHREQEIITVYQPPSIISMTAGEKIKVGDLLYIDDKTKKVMKIKEMKE